LLRRPDQFESPSCATVGGDFWFPEKENEEQHSRLNSNLAKAVCSGCFHRIECAEWGIAKERHGIWGGLVERERRKIRSDRGITLNQEDNVA
jgi:WhiB family redox-sensing transcriptional regulator